MNKAKKYFLLLLLLCQSQLAYSYVHNQTKSGIPVHWPAASQNVDIFINPQSSQDLLSSDIQSIATKSINEWNGLSRINIRTNWTSGKNQNDLNELYFSSDPSIFGNNVIGVTMVSFNETNGEIVSADILINDTIHFSSTQTATYYLGNVITHEAGHFLGLGHGQVTGSTMYYALTRGQNQVSDDDKAGLYSIYPNGDSSKGAITGTIVGGKNLALVFGAHVQAISVKTGKVMGAAISEINGKFVIDGLPQNDQYLIYTGPIRQLGLPSNYANARSDFCEGSTKYRGSFFQSCGANSEGFPEAVRLNSSSVNTGNITIRCGLDTPPEYIQNKGIASSSFNINTYTASGMGGSFVGFFSSSEYQQPQVEDSFKINFSNVQTWDPNSSFYVELKVMNQFFSAPFKVNVGVRRVANYEGASTYPIYTQATDGWVNIDSFVSGVALWDINKFVQGTAGWINADSFIRIPINGSLSSDNDFEIKITPDFSNPPTGIPAGISLPELFADTPETMFFYLVTATIVKKNLDGSFTQVASKNDLLSDNTMCPDAINTYALANFSATRVAPSDRKKSAGCGTVEDVSNGPGGGGGPGGFTVGLLLCFIISYALSRYSKMA